MRDNFSMAKSPASKEKPTYFFREWRKKRGYTQEVLAEKVGLAPPSISQIESGKQGFTDSTLVDIANALKCRPGDLLLWAPDKVEVSTAPIRGDQDILAVLKRIAGLSERDIDAAFFVISNALKVNKVESEQAGADDRSQFDISRRESTPSR